MSGARVQSIDALKSFRLALLKFAEAANSVLTDADATLKRVVSWLETEQPAHWEHQIRHRAEAVAQARLQVQIKRSCRNVDGSPGSAIEEEKALKLAIRRLEEAEQKLAATRRSARRLQREILDYRSQVQRLSTAVTISIPRAAARLEALTRSLESYADLPQETTEVASEAQAIEHLSDRTADSSSMVRPTSSAKPESADSATNHHSFHKSQEHVP